SLLTTLGLRTTPSSPTPNRIAIVILINWFLAHGVLNTRTARQQLRLDSSGVAWYDLLQHGEAAVRSGKMTRRQLERLKRRETAYTNVIEGFPLFLAGALLALFVQVPPEIINSFGIWFSILRVTYAAAYVLIESEGLRFVPSLLWWCGDTACFAALMIAGKRL
ncbi:uncharacterized protein BP01DRAFT_296732, partial [Aspergillus saccharolyticus JOP 1030-1]